MKKLNFIIILVLVLGISYFLLTNLKDNVIGKQINFDLNKFREDTKQEIKIETLVNISNETNKNMPSARQSANVEIKVVK